MYEIGGQIRKLRERCGYTQKEFAQVIGAKNTTVSNWEKGLTRPDADMIAVICKTLQVSADELLNIVISHIAVTPVEHDIILQYRAKPEMQPAILAILGIDEEK